MQLIVNGAARDVTGPADLASVVREVSDRECGIAVAVNREVSPRSDWTRTVLTEGDRIDVVTAVQGG